MLDHAEMPAQVPPVGPEGGAVVVVEEGDDGGEPDPEPEQALTRNKL